MSKENTTSVNFIFKSLNSLGVCDIEAKGCSKKIVTEITIKDHPEAVRKKVCENPACAEEAKLRLRRKII